MPRTRRSAANRKSNHRLRDKDEIEEHGQEQNEQQRNFQVTQLSIEQQVISPSTRRATSDQSEPGLQLSRLQPQISQQASGKQVMTPRTQKAAREQNGCHRLQDKHLDFEMTQQTTDQKGSSKQTRGPTYSSDIWARKPNEGRIQISFNKKGQPVGPNRKKLTRFLGTLARNGNFVPLDIEDWRKVPKVRKDEMIKMVKERFEVPQDTEHWILLSICNKRRHWRSRVKSECFNPTLPNENQVYNRPVRVNEDQWKNMLPHWAKEDAKEVSEKNKDPRQFSSLKQTTGKLSFDGVEEQLKEQVGRSPSLEEIFDVRDTESTCNPPNVGIGDAFTQIGEHKLPPGSQDKVGPSNSFAKVKGKDPHDIPRSRRSAAKRKLNHRLPDEDEIEECGQERNEQEPNFLITQQKIEKQVMAPSTRRATADQNELGQQQSRLQSQTQISQQASGEQGTAKRTRGPTYLHDVWARKLNEGRIQVSFNKRGQPVGPNRKKLTGFLGTLARNGDFVPLDIEDWRKVPKVRKDEMIKIVKERFEVPQGTEHWILLSIRNNRRRWRSRVKSECFNPTLPIEKQVYSRPVRVNEDQWKNMLPHWAKEDSKELSKKNKDIGKLSSAEVEQLKEQLHRSPSHEFDVCDADSTGNPPNDEIGDGPTQMEEHQFRFPPGSQEKVGPCDSFAKVNGKDPHGMNSSNTWADIPSHNTCYRMVLENQAALAKMEEKMDRAIADFQQRMQPQQNPNIICVPHPPTLPHQSCNSINLGHKLQVGGSVLLKSMFDVSKSVAKGYLRSVDPNQKVGGIRLGSNFYAVEISIPMDLDEDLIRPYSIFSTIGDAIGTWVAWPHHLVIHDR